MGDAPVPELASRMYKSCMKSDHPNINICKTKVPNTKFARKTHKVMKNLLRRIKKRRAKQGKGGKGGKNKGSREVLIEFFLSYFPKENLHFAPVRGWGVKGKRSRYM